jgi:hypothetical protein
MSDVTRILEQMEQGERAAAEQLFPLVYQELRTLAAARLAQEKPGQTLEATALVHEAYLRLVDTKRAQHWKSRGHFFAAAAEAMRRILIESARSKARAKRGGDWRRVDLENLEVAASVTPDQLVANRNGCRRDGVHPSGSARRPATGCHDHAHSGGRHPEPAFQWRPGGRRRIRTQGLQFFKPATLTIQAPQSFDSQHLVGFGYEGAGEQFHLVPVKVQNSTLTFNLSHFSGVGAGQATPQDLANQARFPPSTAEVQAIQQLALLTVNAAEQGEVADQTKVVAILRTWYNQSIAPHLTAAGSDVGFYLSAFHEFIDFIGQCLTFDVGADTPIDLGSDFVTGLLAPELKAGNSLFIAATDNAVRQANARAIAQFSIDPLLPVAYFIAFEVADGFDPAGTDLDTGTIEKNLAAQIQFSFVGDPPKTVRTSVGVEAVAVLTIGGKVQPGHTFKISTIHSGGKSALATDRPTPAATSLPWLQSWLRTRRL